MPEARGDDWDVAAIRSHFDFPDLGRTVTNNAASTQPPRELVDLLARLTAGYENVHRGQSSASQEMTRLFEGAYDTIATFVGAPSRRCIAVYRNATEVHNSNFVPWHALCREILPAFGRRVECRIAGFDPLTGELDVDQLATLIDERTKLVCCTGASNFLGTRTPLPQIRALATASGYVKPDGERRAYLLVDGAQLVPGSAVDVQALDVDYLSFSFHKMLAPFGVGVLYARQELLESAPPFLYGGDMIAEGRVFNDHVEYADLLWRYRRARPTSLARSSPPRRCGSSSTSR